MTGGTLAAKQVELLKESFPDLPRLTVLGDSLSTAQLVGAEHATGWLGRQDSNLGMAESKSTQFPCSVNTHSEIQLKFDRLRINGLASDSEWSGASADDAIQKAIAERAIIDPQIQARLAASRV